MQSHQLPEQQSLLSADEAVASDFPKTSRIQVTPQRQIRGLMTPAIGAFSQLPPDLLIRFLTRYLSISDLGALARTCKNFRDIIRNMYFTVQVPCRLLVTDEEGNSETHETTGYIRGTHAQIKQFYHARRNQVERLEQINQVPGIDSADVTQQSYSQTKCLNALSVCMLTTMLGASTGLLCSAGATLEVLKSCGFWVCLGGPTIVACGLTTALCASTVSESRALRARTERETLNTQLANEPANDSLHGCQFSWEPLDEEPTSPKQLRMS